MNLLLILGMVVMLLLGGWIILSIVKESTGYEPSEAKDAARELEKNAEALVNVFPLLIILITFMGIIGGLMSWRLKEEEQTVNYIDTELNSIEIGDTVNGTDSLEPGYF